MTPDPSPQQPPILLAEDRNDDILLMRLALEKAGITNPLFVVQDGQEACDYLAGYRTYSDRQKYPLPSLLLLDIRMPRMNGFDVLAWLSSNPKFNDLPVVVLSTSDLDTDHERARCLGAIDYRSKPAGLDGLAAMLKELHGRWLAQERRTRESI
jgi:CheY-like chemotaxis protein